MSPLVKHAILGAFIVLAGCGSSPDNVKLNTESKEELAAIVGSIQSKYGDEAARTVVQDIALVISDRFSATELDEAYLNSNHEELARGLERLRDEALDEINGMTVAELREKAAPLEHEYRLNRKEKAGPRLEEFEKQKAKLRSIEALKEAVQISQPVIKELDVPGYVEPILKVRLKNSSDRTIRAIDVQVQAAPADDSSKVTTSHVRFTFPEHPVEPGSTVVAGQVLSPLSDLTRAVAQGGADELSVEALVIYTIEDGRVEADLRWTEEMEANLNKLREFASYEG